MKFDTIQQQKYFYLNGNFHFSFSSKVFRASLSVYGRWLNSYFWISRRLTVNIPGHPYNSRRKQGMPPYHSKGRIIISFVTKFTGTLTISVLFRGPSFSFKDDEKWWFKLMMWLLSLSVYVKICYWNISNPLQHAESFSQKKHFLKK